MKKLFAGFAAVICAAAVGVCACAHSYGSVVVMGDSIASGYGLSGYASGDNYSAAESFGSLLSSDCSLYSNLAVDGRTAEELLSAFEGELSDSAAAADSIVISIGGNDFLRPMTTALTAAMMENTDLMSSIMSGDFDQSQLSAYSDEIIGLMLNAAMAVDTSAIVENIRGVVAEIESVNSDCEIILLTIYNPFEGVQGMEQLSEAAQTKLGQLNDGILSMAGGNVRVADVNAAFSGHALEYTNIASMDIHPNSAGHAVIYSLLSEMLTEHPQEASDSSAASDAVSDVKGSPDTGVGGVASAVGAAVLAGAAAVIVRKRHA